MDYQNAEFYKLNKNNPDLVYIFADETITYKKEEVDGKLTIVEYRKKDHQSLSQNMSLSEIDQSGDPNEGCDQRKDILAFKEQKASCHYQDRA